MANEASIITNPDLTPGAASSGYQRQNAILTALMNGMDCSVIEGGVGKVTVKISGPIDVNGILYSIASDAVLTPIGGAGNYCIYLDGAGNTLTPTLTMTPGVFDRTKNAHYTAGGKRILNWMIQYDGTNARVYKLGQDQWEDKLTANGTWTAMFSKVYEIWVTGKGGNGGNAFVDHDHGNYIGAAIAGGGGAAATGKKRIFIEAGTTWAAVFSAVSAGNTTFSDGIITLSAQNGYVGESLIGEDVEITSQSIIRFGGGGDGGHILSGFDLDIIGGYGGLGNFFMDSGDGVTTVFKETPVINAAPGANSFYGAGGYQKHTKIYLITNSPYGASTTGSNGQTYGSGGGGAAVVIYGDHMIAEKSGGTGASGIIRIIG